MPELPDVTIYVEHLSRRIAGRVLEKVRLASPFVVRSVEPSIKTLEGRPVCSVARLGKRIVLGFEEDYFLVFHLMIAGRLRWKPRGTKLPRRYGLAAFDFEAGTLVLTEAGTKRRASIHAVEGREALEAFDRGGLEIPDATVDKFREALQRENHTLKRTLTDPRLFSGIGNAYSDEILHRAGLSPVLWSQRLDEDAIVRLFAATRETLEAWTDRLREQAGPNFPDKVTAFHDEMAVHGRFGKPCPTCGASVQRITYAENETNYCATCQTGGKLLADRSLSRLLKKDWPKTVAELEEKLGRG